MDDEKYGIELELELGAFKKQVKDVQKEAKKIQKAFDPNDISGLNISYWDDASKNMGGFIDKVNKIRSATKTAGVIDYDKNAIGNIVDGYGKVEQKVKEAKDNIKILNKETKKITSIKKINIDTSGTSKNFDKVISKVKRFGLSLLSIRSAYMLVSKASSAYLAQDEQLSNKLQAVWIGLGSLLSPVIEAISNILLKGVKYINLFIKALTGVDLLAKATSKSMSKATGSAKSLNKALAGFDELTNIDSDASGGLALGWADALKDVDDVSFEKLRKWFLGSDKKDFKGILQDNIKSLETFLKSMKETLKSVAGVVFKPLKTAFEDVMNQLSPLIEPVKAKIIEMIEQTKPIWNDTVNNYLKPLWKSFVDYMKPNVVDPILEFFRPIGIKIYNFIVPYANMIIDLINNTFGVFGVNLKHWEYKSEQTGDNVEKELSGNFANISTQEQNLSNQTINIKTNTSALDTLGNKIGTIFDKLKELVTRHWKIETKIEASKGSTFSNILNPIRDTLSRVGIKLPFLATGTNYVPQDQLAMIHKGEAVIPKKFNSQEYFGGSDETNAKLDDLIEAVRNIEINPYTTIRDVGKASLSYINNKSRQLGESVVV